MSAFDVLDRHGTAALLRFLGAVALFVALHLLRVPFVLLARLLEAGMGRVDGYLTGALTATGPTTGPTGTPSAGSPHGTRTPAGVGRARGGFA